MSNEGEVKLKRCSKGDECIHPMGCWQPATTEYFNSHKRMKDGFASMCRTCRSVTRKFQYQEDVESMRSQKRNWYANNKERVSRQLRGKYEIDAEYRAKIAVRSKQWREENPEKRYSIHRRYYESHRSVCIERSRNHYHTYRARHLLRIRVSGKAYRKTLHGKAVSRASASRSRARKANLPDTLTSYQWERAIEYFGYTCAVCGRQLKDLFGTHTAAIDHWIPLTSPDCPGTIATNIVPLCHGEGGCNNSKGRKPPRVWLADKFGTKKANEILKRIQEYFAWVIERDERA